VIPASTGWTALLVGLALGVTGCPGEVPPGDDDSGPAAECDPAIGAVEPLLACSASAPCTRLPSMDDRESVEVETEVPSCATSAEDRPGFDDGPAAVRTDADGIDRHTCVFVPDGASSASPLPLLLFMHGAYGSADDVYDATSLRSKAEGFDLSGDPARPGFVLLSVQGRNLHWPTADPRDGAHHDVFHRDLAAPSANPDVHNLDLLIDALVEQGAVDPERVYVAGWSNGGFFAQLYAIARHEQPTPGGNLVAAAAVFSAADPFHEARAGQEPSCRLDPYPTSTVPIMVVSQACDLVACDEAQAEDLEASGVPVAPGFVVETWMEDLASLVGDHDASWRIVDGFGQPAEACTGPALCGPAIATLGHVRWPDGIADGSGIDHEADMLAFLRQQASSR